MRITYSAPFMVFAFELKEKLKRKGVTVHNNHQLQEMAAPNWVKLSSEEKEKYKRRARLEPPTLNFNKSPDISRVYRNTAQDRNNYDKIIEDITRLINDVAGKQFRGVNSAGSSLIRFQDSTNWFFSS